MDALILFGFTHDIIDAVKVGFIVRVGCQATGIATARHVGCQMEMTSEHEFVVVAIAIGALADVFEAVVIE